MGHPQEKRIVDMKGFVEEWAESSNHRNDGEECIASWRILHLKSYSRINVKEHRSAYLFSANGACSLKAWGNAPGLGIESSQSAEGATHDTGMNRAFSAGLGIYKSWGVAPG